MAADDDDDLEYYVTFPTPTPEIDDQSESDRECSLETSISKNEPVVVLIGWINGGDKYLSKLSDIYSTKGCTTVRYNPKNKDFASDECLMIAKKLLEVILEMNLIDNPVMFHVFSNGGCLIYNEIRKELKNNSDFDGIEVIGVIYDSAPGKSRLFELYLSQYRGMFKPFLQIFAYGLSTIVMGVNFLLQSVGLNVFPVPIYDEMMFSQDGYPELYLYSKTDEITAAADVEEIIQRRQIQGVDISNMVWDDSPHVQHFTIHREAYINSCYNFFQKCIQQYGERKVL